MFMANFPTYYLTPGALSTNIGGGITNNGIVQWDGEFQLVEYF
jgi:hypothetical protein